MSGREGFRGSFRKREPKYRRLRETSQAQRIGQARGRSTGRRSWRGWCIRGKEAWDRIEGFSQSGNTFAAVTADLQGSITYDFTPASVVPEPASFALLGASLLGFAVIRRRKA
jgi:hypothetical protein